MNNENTMTPKQAWNELFSFSRRHIPAILISLLFIVGATVLQIMAPDKLRGMVNEISGALGGGMVDMQALKHLAVLLVILYVTGSVLNFVQGVIMANVTQAISKNLRTSLLQKFSRLPLSYFDSTSQGDVLSRMTNDVDTIGTTLNQSLGLMLSASVMFIGALIIMFVTNWIMALTAIVSSLLGTALVMVIMSQSQKYFMQQQEGLGSLNGYIEEIYSGHNIVKVYNHSAEADKTFEGRNQFLYNSSWRAQFLSGMMMPLMTFVGYLGYVAVCAVGSVLTMKGMIDFGVIMAFMMYVNFFSNPLSQLAQAIQNMQRLSAASVRVFSFLNEPEMADESTKTKLLPEKAESVEFRHVRFGYDPEKPIIKDFNLRVRPGQKIAIVGPTGAGKTTLVNLLMRFYEVNGGQILIDGVPATDVTREAVHQQFSMVLQDTWLFEGTIRENMVYLTPNVTDEQVIAASKAVGLHHFVKTLPDGYDTVLDDKVNLSQGQRQLVTIARAMLRNAPMLILDEATSSVDARTEVLIQKAMDQLMAGRTSFVIAHRLSTIQNADMILVLKDGDVIESGSHEELLRKGGFYAELYNSQFEK
jgi:ATP-binding cassette, subfamily B, multidrug efflux pump